DHRTQSGLRRGCAERGSHESDPPGNERAPEPPRESRAIATRLVEAARSASQPSQTKKSWSGLFVFASVAFLLLFRAMAEIPAWCSRLSTPSLLFDSICQTRPLAF